MKFSSRIIHVITLLTVILSCRKTDDLIDFTEEDEILLGGKLSVIINQDATYNVIPQEGNAIPYGYANSRLAEITASTSITKSDDFIWTISIMDDESRQAFALPGGYIYVTSGMIFFLENEDQFSGLIAQLVAHINQSHITEMLFFKYGINNLRTIARSGNEESLRQIIKDLDLNGSFLEISRANQLQADTLTVSLLSGTSQSCESNGLAFNRILNVQADQQLGFIGAYGINISRIESIQEYASTKGCNTGVDDESSDRFRSFRFSLP